MLIYKEYLPVTPGDYELELYSPGTVLSVGLDPGGSLCFWYAAEPERGETTRVVMTVAWTGLPNNIRPGLTRFVGTVLMEGLVYHLFQRIDLGTSSGPNVQIVDTRKRNPKE